MSAQIHIPFPSIEQFRNIRRNVDIYTEVAGKPLPKITFEGTVKLHGTNAAISAHSSNPSEFWCQSRERICSPLQDNAGFAMHVQQKGGQIVDLLEGFIKTARALFDLSENFIISVYGEWCGGNIQNGVAINKLPKMFVVFAVSVSNESGSDARWLRGAWIKEVLERRNHIFASVFEYQTWIHEVDFSSPEASQDYFASITEQVEKECPVAKKHGISGIGEGVVWRAIKDPANGSWLTQEHLDSLVFKVKGREHSVTKVKTLASIDIDKVNSIKELCESFCTQRRFVQGLTFLQEAGKPTDKTSTTAFLEWIKNDILKEESDTIKGNGFTINVVMPVVAKLSRQWYFQFLELNHEH